VVGSRSVEREGRGNRDAKRDVVEVFPTVMEVLLTLWMRVLVSACTEILVPLNIVGPNVPKLAASLQAKRDTWRSLPSLHHPTLCNCIRNPVFVRFFLHNAVCYKCMAACTTTTCLLDADLLKMLCPSSPDYIY
jgi:hypothetical protein